MDRKEELAAPEGGVLTHDEAAMTQLQDNLRLMALLLAKFEQREARMQQAVERQTQTLQQQVALAERKLDGLVAAAAARMAEQARKSLSSSLREMEQAVGDTTRRLRAVSRLLWTWMGGFVLLAVLGCVAAWAVLGYYRRELSEAKQELARYENAIPVVRAYHASDATLCGDRLCVNVDPAGARSGEARQYRPARARAR